MEEEFSAEESLQVINRMIMRAKQSFSRISFYFLLWGWLLLGAGLTEYVLQHVVHFQHWWIGWPIAGFGGGITAGIYGSRQSRKQMAMGYMDRVFTFLWVAFTITLAIMIVGSVLNKISPTPYIIVLIGLPTFVSGGIMKFKPLLLGGIIFWAVGIASFFAFKEYSALLFCFSILCGYIIPGYMLRMAEKKGVIG